VKYILLRLYSFWFPIIKNRPKGFDEEEIDEMVRFSCVLLLRRVENKRVCSDTHPTAPFWSKFAASGNHHQFCSPRLHKYLYDQKSWRTCRRRRFEIQLSYIQSFIYLIYINYNVLGAIATTWLALLPKNVEGPKGAFVWRTKEEVDWWMGLCQVPSNKAAVI